MALRFLKKCSIGFKSWRNTQLIVLFTVEL